MDELWIDKTTHNRQDVVILDGNVSILVYRAPRMSAAFLLSAPECNILVSAQAFAISRRECNKTGLGGTGSSVATSLRKKARIPDWPYGTRHEAKEFDQKAKA